MVVCGMPEAVPTYFSAWKPKLTDWPPSPGRLTAAVLNFSRGSQEKLAHISIMQGKTAVPVTELHAGDIGAVAKLKDTLTGDTLGDKSAPIQYPRVKLPEPAITFAIEPKSRADEDKLGPGLHKLMEEDAMLRFFRDPQTQEFLIAGTGQQHIEVVVAKLKKALGDGSASFGRTLEIGAGTGYFTLNLLRAGLIRDAVCTDISQGMLDELGQSATRLGVDVETVRCDAQALPFADDSFDLVFGHAVLHHLPDLDAAFREFRRVLRPGGRIAFCGEPSEYGDRLRRAVHAPAEPALIGRAIAISNSGRPSIEYRRDPIDPVARGRVPRGA